MAARGAAAGSASPEPAGLAGGPQAAASERSTGRADVLAAALLAVAAFLPFVRGALQGRSFYFRDLALHFFPLRRFAVEGLRQGELRYWNPLLHEGIPSPFPPVSYPLDLLQALWPSEAGFSLLLALHVPLAALAFFVLARSRSLSPVAAAGGGLVYALGGFALSTLNLYVYVQALAWGPLVVWSLGRAARAGGRALALAALATAVSVSTVGAEVVGQALLVGVALALDPPRRAAAVRVAGALLLGVGLAAPTLLVMGSVVAGTERAAGFPTAVVLAQSVHPLTLAQVVIGDWHGELSDLANRWWGSNFFSGGFPYVLSLYLGALALALAALGAGRTTPHRGRLLLLASAALLVCLGRWAGLAPLVDALPALRAFRFPVKAFYTAHLVAAVLAAHGLNRLARGERRDWGLLAALGIVAAVALCGLTLVPHLWPQATAWFLSGFAPPQYGAGARSALSAHLARDAALGGLVALAGAAVASGVLRRKLSPSRGALAVVLLVAADLLRTGAGLNPQVEPAFLRPSEEMARWLGDLRGSGRVMTCPPQASGAYWRARAERPAAHDLWTFATHIDTLTPNANLPVDVASAYSEDLTSLVPISRLPEARQTCARLFQRRLRAGVVGRVLSLDALPDAELPLMWTAAPARIAPLVVHAYGLDPLPRVAVQAVRGPGAAGRVLALREGTDWMELELEADTGALLVLRDGFAPGWWARVDGRPAPVAPWDERYRAVPLGAGRHTVQMRYRPPGLRSGLALLAASLGLVAVLAARRPRTEATRRRAQAVDLPGTGR